MSYLLIHYDDSRPVFEELELPEEPRAFLDACYTALGCSTIQTAPTVLSGILLVVDEAGKLFDGWLNRINKVASLLYDSDWDPIVGDAILARLEGENLVPLSSSDIDLLKRRFP